MSGPVSLPTSAKALLMSAKDMEYSKSLPGGNNKSADTEQVEGEWEESGLGGSGGRGPGGVGRMPCEPWLS